ncbi:hypothetical protein BDN72DRAFT_844982 [Pluteus cervinus]|uniref:Uncharacterized protein n=1 Tax=Pluteus cervinus TaxID=181527 RepID=A0ACD3AL09_9AGAR|nr:hypothetical protein BDN72DRAFT_844982 [Pluteus cervinus]
MAGLIIDGLLASNIKKALLFVGEWGGARGPWTILNLSPVHVSVSHRNHHEQLPQHLLRHSPQHWHQPSPGHLLQHLNRLFKPDRLRNVLRQLKKVRAG